VPLKVAVPLLGLTLVNESQLGNVGALIVRDPLVSGSAVVTL
jgi:hypothetical protein